MSTIAVIGAGFFGVLSANHLARQYPSYKIKLLTRSDFTYFLVSSVRAPVFNEPEGTVIPLREVVDKEVEIIKGDVEFFNESFVSMKINGKETDISFDCLVIATGSKWGDPIGSTYQFGDNYEEYFKEQYELLANAKDIVLIGGGYTNVELAGELHDKFNDEMINNGKRITMIHSEDLLLASRNFYSMPLRKRCTEFFQNETKISLILNAKATRQDDKIMCDNGQTIKADLVLESIGIIPSVPKNSILKTNAKGFIEISDTFQCKNCTNIFAIGDVIDFEYKGLVKREEWTNCLVKNIGLFLNGDNKFLEVKRPTGNFTCVVSLGSKNGCGQVVVPILGTFKIPEWYVVRRKSRNLLRECAKELFKW